MDFPRDNDTMICPHCDTNTFFTQLQSTIWNNSVQTINARYQFRIDCAKCYSCGGVLIKYTIITASGMTIFRDIVYPLAGNQEYAPNEIKGEYIELKNDFDEAVNVELISPKSAVFLLGRCLERMLVNRAEATHGQTIGVMLKDEKVKEKIPKDILEDLTDGVLIARNSSCHIWQDDNGDELNIDPQDVAYCFEIIRLLFEHFYIAPKRRQDSRASLEKLKNEKQ